MFPYHDENDTLRTPVVTFALIAITVFAWVVLQGAGTDPALAASVCNLGLIPGELTLSADPGSGFRMGPETVCLIDPGRQVQNVVTSMFMHGSWMHLLGNMWFLWLFGNNVEDAMTRPRFIAFYLVTGLGAALAQVFADPSSGIPMVGASGAISGVMGAYLVLFPRVRVYTLVPLGFFMQSFPLPAWVMLIYWAVLQIFGGIGSAISEQSGGVAFWAHLGGFLAGVVAVKVFERKDRVRAHAASRWEPRGSWR
jgi:membrane associated rhomboid family serine protease